MSHHCSDRCERDHASAPGITSDEVPWADRAPSRR
jgi:hypothetical protein